MTNERLHALFIEHVFKLEQEVYVREGINWQMVEYQSNTATIQLIEKSKPSIFSLINDATNSSSADTPLLRNLHQTFTTPDLMKKYAAEKWEGGGKGRWF